MKFAGQLGRMGLSAAFRRGSRFPPLEPRPDELLLIRQPMSALALVALPWGDSYMMPPDQLELYLRRLGASDAGRMVDLLWSFYAVWVGTVSWECRRVSRQDAMASLGRKKNVQHEAAHIA